MDEVHHAAEAGNYAAATHPHLPTNEVGTESSDSVLRRMSPMEVMELMMLGHSLCGSTSPLALLAPDIIANFLVPAVSEISLRLLKSAGLITPPRQRLREPRVQAIRQESQQIDARRHLAQGRRPKIASSEEQPISSGLWVNRTWTPALSSRSTNFCEIPGMNSASVADKEVPTIDTPTKARRMGMVLQGRLQALEKSSFTGQGDLGLASKPLVLSTVTARPRITSSMSLFYWRDP